MVGSVHPPPTIDVFIVLALGVPDELAQQLSGWLVERGLRVRVERITTPRMVPLPPACAEAKRSARLTVVLGLVGEETRYAILPSPRFPGQAPVFAPPGTTGAPGQVELGLLTKEIAAFAARIEARLRS